MTIYHAQGFVTIIAAIPLWAALRWAISFIFAQPLIEGINNGTGIFMVCGFLWSRMAAEGDALGVMVTVFFVAMAACTYAVDRLVAR